MFIITLITEVNINDLIKNKKSVIYFWNDEFITEDFLSSRIKHLTKKHPNLNFIGVKFGANNSFLIIKVMI